VLLAARSTGLEQFQLKDDTPTVATSACKLGSFCLLC